MTRLDDRLVPKVKDLIDRLGKSATVTTEDDKTYDSGTGKTANTGTTIHTIKISPPAPYNKNYDGASIVKVGDQRTFVAAKDLTFTPEPGLLLKVDSDEWRMVSINTLRSGELIAAYEIQLRK